jgi:hypothetical protein
LQQTVFQPASQIKYSAYSSHGEIQNIQEEGSVVFDGPM